MAKKVRTLSLPFLQSFLNCMGRFPFTKEKKKVKEEVEESMWVFNICSIASFPFHIVSSLVFLWLVVMLMGYITLWVNSSPQQPRRDVLSVNCSFDNENASNMTSQLIIVIIVNNTADCRNYHFLGDASQNKPANSWFYI